MNALHSWLPCALIFAILCACSKQDDAHIEISTTRVGKRVRAAGKREEKYFRAGSERAQQAGSTNDAFDVRRVERMIDGYDRQSRLQEARKAFDPEFARTASLKDLHDVMISPRDYLTALRYSEVMLERATNQWMRSDARLYIASYAIDLWDFDKALEALEAMPDDHSTPRLELQTYNKLQGLARLAEVSCQLERALEIYKQIAETEFKHNVLSLERSGPVPENSCMKISSLASIADLMLQLGQSTDEAREIYERVAAIPDDDPAYGQIGHKIQYARRCLKQFDKHLKSQQEIAEFDRFEFEPLKKGYERYGDSLVDRMAKHYRKTRGKPMPEDKRVKLRNKVKFVVKRYGLDE